MNKDELYIWKLSMFIIVIGLGFIDGLTGAFLGISIICFIMLINYIGIIINLEKEIKTLKRGK